MKIHHHILSGLYYPAKIYNASSRDKGHISKGRLRVLLYHDISPQNEERFAKHIKFIQKSWKFVTPEQFVLMMKGLIEICDDCVLLTFDDGFASNRGIAERILEPLGIRALFFVVTNFVLLGKEDNWRSFVAKNIHPGMKPEEVPVHWRSMSISDLSSLLNSGHSIGSHTTNHFRLSSLDDQSLVSEISEGADKLERLLGVSIDHFSFSFGNFSSFSAQALAVAKSRFKYIYSGMRGNNSANTPAWAIRRDSIQVTDTRALVGSYLEGTADLFYVQELKAFELWDRP